MDHFLVIGLISFLCSPAFCQTPLSDDSHISSLPETASTVTSAASVTEPSEGTSSKPDGSSITPSIGTGTDEVTWEETTSETGVSEATESHSETSDVTTNDPVTETTVAEEDTGPTDRATGGPGEGRRKPRPGPEWFPLMMLAVGLTAILATLALVVRRVMLDRRQGTGQDFPMSFSNPIYDVALASLRTGSEGIAEAQDALEYEPWRRPE